MQCWSGGCQPKRITLTGSLLWVCTDIATTRAKGTSVWWIHRTSSNHPTATRTSWTYLIPRNRNRCRQLRRIHDLRRIIIIIIIIMKKRKKQSNGGDDQDGTYLPIPTPMTRRITPFSPKLKTLSGCLLWDRPNQVFTYLFTFPHVR